MMHYVRERAWGYSSTSKTYRVYNKRALVIKESVHVAFDETPPQVVGKCTSFDVAGLDTEDIVEVVTNKKLLRKTRTTRIKNFRKTFPRMKNKEPHHCLFMIGSPQETTL
ncbi:hypothetical protein MTR_4g075350 [Medicago truncatula]|uniref:Retroviral polymerase SH3-like domain-containing protein n=1 Tax=Medicago truncatula TaxID=3880 RepID=G7JPK7_MEDTR|nr:hypothetical protein MTR_4g075350 [Medicago truncatula]